MLDASNGAVDGSAPPSSDTSSSSQPDALPSFNAGLGEAAASFDGGATRRTSTWGIRCGRGRSARSGSVDQDYMNSRSDNFWIQRAEAQVALRSYRLAFRNYFYEDTEGRHAVAAA